MTNIFWFHEDPRIAARMHADIHIPKMAIEAAQCVATAFRRNGYEGDDIYEEYGSPGDQRTPQEWCTESRAHAISAIKYGISILGERQRRWPQFARHKTYDELTKLWERIDHDSIDWPNKERVSDPPTFGIEDRFVMGDRDTDGLPGYVRSYRAYAIREKDYYEREFTACERPDWAE